MRAVSPCLPGPRASPSRAFNRNSVTCYLCRPNVTQNEDWMEELSESERQALNRAGRGQDLNSRRSDDLMLRAIEKSGMDPLQAQQARDPNRLLAKAQGPVIALGGLLLIGIGGWRVWNAWGYSTISPGGIAMLFFGVVVFIGGIVNALGGSD